MNKELLQKFLTDTDDTGRFIVTSTRTGKKYFVEPIGDPHTNWGSVVPGSKPGDKLANKKGFKKYRGSVDSDESLITKENGFAKIHELDAGVSPMAYIDMLDDQYPDKAND